jgi:hypothetical protein
MSLIQRHRTLFIDIGISLLLLAATVYYSIQYVSFDIPPFEDAAMLMRYSEHLAHGYGIVWNIGEPPVDGATDFLFMVVTAALVKIGLTVGRSVRVIGYCSHLFTVLLVYWANRRIWKAEVPLALFSGLYLAFGTGLSYVAAFFGSPFFALSAVFTWMFGLLLINHKDNPFWISLAFALVSLITGLIRPEGVILAVLMLVAVVVLRGFRKSIPMLIIFFGVFLILGGAYFIWRWQYFGYPLPNPYYKKGGGGLHWDSFHNSLLNTLRLCLPFLLAFILGLRKQETTKQALTFLIPIIGFAAAFVLISDETNFGARFQYGLVPIVLITWIPLVRGLDLTWLKQAKVREKSIYVVAALAVGVGFIYYSWFQNCFLTSYQQTCLAPYEYDGRYEMGKMLANYRGKGYIIATTEAGLLPYYSGWTAIDTWGLNDSWITHNGDVTAEYLDRYQPQVIAFHAYYSPLVPPKLIEKNLAQDWFRMTITLKDYAEQKGYVLAAVFGDSPYDTHYYYVQPDFPDGGQIIKQITTMSKYYWFATGKKAINYAEISLP